MILTDTHPTIHPNMKTPNSLAAAPAMTDAEVRSALWASGIPAIYHSKERSLHSLQTSVATAASEWASNAKQAATLGACASVTFDGIAGNDLTYLMARAMVLKGAAVMVVSLPILAELTTNRFALRNADKLEDMHGRDYLIVVGALGSGNAPYSDERMFEVEWSLKSWILAGKPLVLQGSETINDCKWWSKGFVDFFLAKQSNVFGSETVKPMSAPARKSGGARA